jgi:hypothetical protein
MGGDKQFDSLVQLRNTSKPTKLFVQNISKFNRLASLAH